MDTKNPIKFRNDKESEHWSSAWDASKAAKFDSGFCTDAADSKIKDMRQRTPDPTASIKPEAPGTIHGVKPPVTTPPNERPALERVKTAILHELHSGNFTSGLSAALWAVEMELYCQPAAELPPTVKAIIEDVRRISSQWEGSRPQLPSSIIDWLSRTQGRLAALDRGE